MRTHQEGAVTHQEGAVTHQEGTVTHQGMTLVEVMVSLCLLSAVMLAVVSWTQISGRSLASAVEPARWERSAAAALQSIQDDLLMGDFQAGDIETRRVRMEQGRLVIPTRRGSPPGGPLVREYALDRGAGTLIATERIAVERRPDQTEARLLLGNVANWRCILEENEEGKRLRVELVSTEGMRLARRYVLP